VNQGTIDTDDLFRSKDPMAAVLIREMEEDNAAVKSRMAPPGALGLPEALEKKRIAHGITDGAFREQPLFDRILVWQIGPHEDGTADDKSPIVLTDATISREKTEAPRGILVSAGASALDQLESHGCRIGDTVSFLRCAPYRIRVDTVRGHDFYCIVLSAGDLVSSEDLRERLKSGETRLERVTYQDQVTGAKSRVSIFVDNDSGFVPQMAVMPPDY
jgi:hypothetical protein